MITNKFANSSLRAAGATITLSAAFFAAQILATSVKASDHIDSPTIAQDRGSDIADFWAFLDPNDNTQIVLLFSTQGFIVSGEHFGMVIFDHNIRYRFEIERTGNAAPDLFLDVTYAPGIGRLTAQEATIILKRSTPRGLVSVAKFTAMTTISNQEPQPAPAPAPVVTTDPVSQMKFFGGVADDPFFLDDTGANRFIASSLAHPGAPNKSLLGARGGRDTYAGFNTMITAVRVPVALLVGNSGATELGFNAVTQRQRVQVNAKGRVVGAGGFTTVDRQGNPLVNNGLILGPHKNAYNGAPTSDDRAGRFLPDLLTSFQNIGTDAAHQAMILNVIQKRGDILRLNLSVPNSGPQGGTNATGGFANGGGRRLTDDVVDGVFTLLNNGVPLSDLVNGNEVPFRDMFPFVADPTQPFPPGLESDDHTRQ